MSSQQLADLLLHHWWNLWPLPPAERMARIEQIEADYLQEEILRRVAEEMAHV